MGSLLRLFRGKAQGCTLFVPACASCVVERRALKNVRHFSAFTTWRTREQVAFFLRGIDAGSKCWHAGAAHLEPISGAAMAITAPEIERDRNLATGLAARLACRRGSLRGTTAGVAPGYVHGNLAVLPEDLAADFLRFCQANPKPCPLIGVSDVGNPRVASLGLDLDIRTDLPGYRVWKDGELVEETADVTPPFAITHAPGAMLVTDLKNRQFAVL